MCSPVIEAAPLHSGTCEPRAHRLPPNSTIRASRFQTIRSLTAFGVAQARHTPPPTRHEGPVAQAVAERVLLRPVGALLDVADVGVVGPDARVEDAHLRRGWCTQSNTGEQAIPICHTH